MSRYFRLGLLSFRSWPLSIRDHEQSILFSILNESSQQLALDNNRKPNFRVYSSAHLEQNFIKYIDKHADDECTRNTLVVFDLLIDVKNIRQIYLDDEVRYSFSRIAYKTKNHVQ